MRFGFTLPNNFGVADPHDVVRLGVEAEQLSFDSVWVNHHVINVGYVHDRLGQAPYHDARSGGETLIDADPGELQPHLVFAAEGHGR